MFYVTMTDRFMSGWGMAEGKDNKLIVECETYEQAEEIKEFADSMDEMKYVNIRSTRPRYGSGVLESWKVYSEMKGWHRKAREEV